MSGTTPPHAVSDSTSHPAGPAASGQWIVARVDRGAADVLRRDRSAADTAPRRVSTRVPGLDLADLVVGDELTLADGGIVALGPRRTLLARASASGQSAVQPLAANVDVVLVTVAAEPPPRVGMIERMVALAWDAGAQPVVVATKSDLSADPYGVVADLEVCAPGVEVHAVSCRTGEGLEDIRGYDQPGRTLALIGRSGAGKSTLANALLDDERFATGEVRRDGKGRHTTVHRELTWLPGGGLLIDTPGLRGAGLALSGDGLDRAFPEIEALAETCRFSDCSHDGEPGCAIAGAIAAGVLSERRLASWRKLGREIAWQAGRHDARLRAEQHRQWKLRIRDAGRARP